MTSTKHKARTWLTFYAEPSANYQRPVEIAFTYTPGAPERGPSYASGGEPADPPEINIDAAYFIGDDQIDEDRSGQYGPLPEWMVGRLADDEAVYNWLCDEAEEDRAVAADEWAEMKADEARGN